MVFYYTTSNIAFITLSLHYVLGFFPGSTVFESLLPILKRVNSSFCCFQFYTPCLTSLFPWLSSLLLMCLKAVIPSLPCSSSLSLLALHSSFKTPCVSHFSLHGCHLLSVLIMYCVFSQLAQCGKWDYFEEIAAIQFWDQALEKQHSSFSR